MGIIKRVVMMLKADAHGVLDLLEDPVDLCNQAIRDMEGDIEVLRGRNQQLEDRHRQLLKQKEQAEQRLSELHGQIEVCLKAETRDLAKGVIKRKLQLEQRLKLLIHRIEEVENELLLGEQRVKEFEERLAAVREKLELLTERGSHGATICPDMNGMNDVWISDEEVEIALRQLEAQSTHTPQR